MPSVVSIPPNINTAAFDATSFWLSPSGARAASLSSEGSSVQARVRVTAARSQANASAPAAVTGLPAVTSDTAATIAAYQDNTVSTLTSRSPSASVTTATASGPANSRRSSALPAGRIAEINRSAFASTNPANRSCTRAGRNGCANGSRCRVWSAPSSESMLAPTTREVENRGSSTVKVVGSRSTLTARSYRVTNHPRRTASHDTGSSVRSRASSGCGSSCSSRRVAPRPIGNFSIATS